jgi:uncharacterized lipoprotein YbaY
MHVRHPGNRCRLAAMLSACEDNRFIAPPPPQVTVALPQQQGHALSRVNGNTSVNTANLVARVQGFVR